MFKIEPAETFVCTVEIPQKGGAIGSIDVEYRYKKLEERIGFANRLKEMNTVDALEEIIHGWSGADLEYSRASLETLLNEHDSAGPLLDAFFKFYGWGIEKN